MPPNGFEVREAHRNLAAPIIYTHTIALSMSDARFYSIVGNIKYLGYLSENRANSDRTIALLFLVHRIIIDVIFYSVFLNIPPIFLN